MSDNIIQLNQDLIHNELKDLVRNSVEETLNALLDYEAYEQIETWRTRKLDGEYPYVYVDGVYLKRSWGGEVQIYPFLLPSVSIRMDAAKSLVLLRL